MVREKKDAWWQMIQLLPSSYNQKRTVMLSYEVLANIYKSRRNHKLDEWHTFCDWIEGLPYSEMITGERNVKEKRPNATYIKLIKELSAVGNNLNQIAHLANATGKITEDQWKETHQLLEKIWD